MVWGWEGWEGMRRLAEVEGNMNAEQYMDILENNLLSSIEESGISFYLHNQCLVQKGVWGC